MAMTFLDTVSCALPTEVVPLHNSSKSTAFARPNHIHGCNLRERVDLNLLTNLIAADGPPDLANKPLRFTVRLGGQLDTRSRSALGSLASQLRNMTPLTTGGKTPGSIQIP
jgi:hypothetical protein